MTRIALGLLVGSLAALPPIVGADAKATRTAAPVEFAVLADGKASRIELLPEVDGVSVAAIWDETFAKLFEFFDRNGDGKLDKAEAARLPAPVALNRAMGNGFTPPVGSAPDFSDLDKNGDGHVEKQELADFYRTAGIGGLQIGAGRLPGNDELTVALLKQLDTDGDGRVSEKQWKAAPETLKKLDANDDELIGAGELVPKRVYPGAAGTQQLSPSTADSAPSTLPLLLLPSVRTDVAWATQLKLADPVAWRGEKAAATWTVRLADQQASPERFSHRSGSTHVIGWAARGKMSEAVASARQSILEPAPAANNSDEADATGRRRTGDMSWLLPVADRDEDGKLSPKEVEAWLDLQAQIARGQVLLTVLDGAGIFEILDVNHDGALGARELRGAWPRLKESGLATDSGIDVKQLPRVVLMIASRGYPRSLALTGPKGPAWFQAMDKNGDGDVSRREFTGGAEAFDKLDTDRDGLLSAAEATGK